MVLPLRDINPREKFPAVNLALVIINVVFFLYELSLGDDLQRFLLSAAFVPATAFAPGHILDNGEAILLSMFLHGGWLHLGGNLLYLWIFGDNVEDRLGHVVYAIFYVLCGFAATLSHALLNPDSTAPVIGASGAIAGVLGAYLVMFPRARVVSLIPLGFFSQVAELPAVLVLGLWFVLQLFSGVTSLNGGSQQATGVAFWAHVGGFITGMLLGWMLNRAARTGPPGPGPRMASQRYRYHS